MIKYNYIVFVFVFLSIQISEQITNYLKQIISFGSVWKNKKKKEAGWIRVFSMSSSWVIESGAKFAKFDFEHFTLLNFFLFNKSILYQLCLSVPSVKYFAHNWSQALKRGRVLVCWQPTWHLVKYIHINGPL